MKYVISESRLDKVVTNYIRKTIGEYRELPTHSGFYKNGKLSALVRDQILVIDYYTMMYDLFGMSNKPGTLSRILTDFVNQYIHPEKIIRITLSSD